MKNEIAEVTLKVYHIFRKKIMSFIVITIYLIVYNNRLQDNNNKNL